MDEYIAKKRYDKPEVPEAVRDRVRSLVHQLIAPDRRIERMFSRQIMQIICPMCNRKVTDILELNLMEQSGLCSQCTSMQAGHSLSWIYYLEPTLVEIGSNLIDMHRTPSQLESLIILRHLERLGAAPLEILHGQWKDLSYVQIDVAEVCMHCLLLGELGVEDYTISRTSAITGITYINAGCRNVAYRWFPDLEKA